jgi:nucleolar protein 53
MGKRVRGAELRAKKRAKVAVDELQEKQADALASATVTDKKDTELFVLDVTGETVHQSQLVPKVKRKKETGLSEKDKQAVARLMEKHEGSAAKLKEIAAQGRQTAANSQRRVRTKGVRGQTKAKFDLWDNNHDALAAVTADVVKANRLGAHTPGIGGSLSGTSEQHSLSNTRRAQAPSQRGMAVDLARSGQSYHPDPVAHKAAIDKAFGIEKRRQDAVDYMETPISNGLSEETRAMMVGDSDTEEEDNAMDEDGDDAPVGLMPKRSLKLTKAERNKQKRVRGEQMIVDKRRINKKLMNEVSEIPRYNKETKKKTRAKQEQREREETLKRLKKPRGTDWEQKVSNVNPMSAPTLPVALSSELKSSLRTLKPKGSLLSDRLGSFRDRKLAPIKATIDGRKKKFHGNRRRKLRVKGSKNNEGVGSDFVVMG